MSTPKRYLCGGYVGLMHEFEHGDWIAYADYALLQAEVERLNSEVFTASCANANMHKHINENARLKAEVARLSAADSYLQDCNADAHEKRCYELEAELERLKAGEPPTEWRFYKDEDTSK